MLEETKLRLTQPSLVELGLGLSLAKIRRMARNTQNEFAKIEEDCYWKAYSSIGGVIIFESCWAAPGQPNQPPTQFLSEYDSQGQFIRSSSRQAGKKAQLCSTMAQWYHAA